MLVLGRAIAYATLFVGLVLVLLPGRFLSWSGVSKPGSFGLPQGAGLLVAASGAALFYGSMALAAYAAIFILLAHTMVRYYEEPALRRKFGTDYEAYRAEVHRWRLRLGPVRVRRAAGGSSRR